MAATITDKIMVASSGTRPNPTTLTAQKSIGASLLNADDLTGWGTSTPVTFVIYKIDSNGNEVVGTRSDWKGIVSGNTITQLTLTAGTDTIYPSGSPVIAVASARWADDFTAAMLVSHNQNGTLKDGSVGNTTITDGSVTTTKIADANITNAKLSTTTGEVGGVWQTYSPTITNFTLGNGTITYCKYTRVGKNVNYKGRFVYGSTSSFTGVATISLPVNAAADYLSGDAMNGGAMITDSGVTVRPGIPHFVTSSTMSIAAIATLTGSNPVFTDYTPSTRDIQTSGPITWSTGDVVQWDVTYEGV